MLRKSGYRQWGTAHRKKEEEKMRRFSSERGAVTIIEAAFVFPITFFIVFFMIMAGEAYYQSAVVERTVTNAAIRGAAQCENPMLREVIKTGSVPTAPDAVDVVPYRYILTGEAKKIAQNVQDDLRKTISSYKPLLFRGMGPRNVSVKVLPHMNVLVSSLEVTCHFDVLFPIRMIFSEDTVKFSYTSHMKAPVGDPAEFVRNVAMIKDILERNEAAVKIAGKASDAMTKIGVYVN